MALPAEDPAGAGDGAGAARRVNSAALLGRQREVVIVHRGQEYRLRVTKSDKLILTK
jgi:hemin uptake protein HemP